MFFVKVPLTDFWDKPILQTFPHSKSRYDFGAFYFAMAGLDLLFDIVVISFPLPAINRLHMSTKKKWQISAIFALAFL